MGWILELLFDLIAVSVADEAARRIPTWGCILLVLCMAGVMIWIGWG